MRGTEGVIGSGSNMNDIIKQAHIVHKTRGGKNVTLKSIGVRFEDNQNEELLQQIAGV